MYPNKFDYYRPQSLAEAVELMSRYGDDARLLAGGQSLIPLLKLRLVNPAVVVDLNGVPGFSYVRQGNDRLAIGALTCHSDVEDSEIIQRGYPAIADAVGQIGDAQVRNLGTAGGSLAHGDPSGDWGAVFLALGGELCCVDPHGTRLIPAPQFFTDMYETARKSHEIVTEIRIAPPQPRSGGAYLKLERRAGDFAVVGVAVWITLDENDVCVDASIGLSGVGPTSSKGAAAERILRGSALTEPAIAAAADSLDADIDPYTDTRAPAEYKRAMAKVYFRKALEVARQRAAPQRQ